MDRDWKRSRNDGSQGKARSVDNFISPDFDRTKRARVDGHPASQLPPSLRGRVTWPNEQPEGEGHETAQQHQNAGNRQHYKNSMERGSRGRAHEHQRQQQRDDRHDELRKDNQANRHSEPRQRHADRDISREKGERGNDWRLQRDPLRDAEQRLTSASNPDRQRASRYDMSSTSYNRQHSFASGGCSREDDAQQHNRDRRVPQHRREQDGRGRSPDKKQRHENSSRAQHVSAKADDRHTSADRHRTSDHQRQQRRSQDANAVDGRGDRKLAGKPADTQQQQRRQNQQQGKGIDKARQESQQQVDKRGQQAESGAATAGGLGAPERSHRRIEFTLVQGPSTANAAELQPRRSSKYSIPDALDDPEQQRSEQPAGALHDTEAEGRDSQHAHWREQQQQAGYAQGHDRPSSRVRELRDQPDSRSGPDARIMTEQPTKPRNEYGNGKCRGNSRERFQPAANDTANNSNARQHHHTQQALDDRYQQRQQPPPQQRPQSARQQQQPSTPVTAHRPASCQGTPRSQVRDFHQQQALPIVSISGQLHQPTAPTSALSKEAREALVAIRKRQAGLVTLQLRVLPISRSLSYQEVWTKAIQASRLVPEQLDGSLVALRRRTAATRALAGRFAAHLLPPVDQTQSVAVHDDSEELRLRHLQQTLDSYGQVSAAACCVKLAEGGSMLLPAELQGLLW